MTTPFYETDLAVEQYLLFHYGRAAQVAPLLPAMEPFCDFPLRCVRDTLPLSPLAGNERALDLGCAVGRSSFELARHFQEVVGIDFSHRFIAAAAAMQKERRRTIFAWREGAERDQIDLELPNDLPTAGVCFEQGDATNLRADLGTFDLVLMANLIDRLPDPARCLARLPLLIRPGGALILTSPYTWLEEYTPRSLWLTSPGGTLPVLAERLAPAFQLTDSRPPISHPRASPQVPMEYRPSEPLAAGLSASPKPVAVNLASLIEDIVLAPNAVCRSWNSR